MTGQQPKLPGGGGGGLNALYWRQIFAIDYVVVNTQKLLHHHSQNGSSYIVFTVNPVLSGHSKQDITKVLMANGGLMNVESIAECSFWSILKYF